MGIVIHIINIREYDGYEGIVYNHDDYWSIA